MRVPPGETEKRARASGCMPLRARTLFRTANQAGSTQPHNGRREVIRGITRTEEIQGSVAP